MKHTISVLVENKFGVLARISGLFSARGYNISSLAVSETLDPTISCMTIVVDAKDEKILEQIKKQLNKLIDVIRIIDFTKKAHEDRELILVKVACMPKDKVKLSGLLEKYSGHALRHNEDSAIVEVVGEQDNIKQALHDLEEKFGIKELVRSGRIAIC